MNENIASKKEGIGADHVEGYFTAQCPLSTRDLDDKFCMQGR